MRFVHDSLPQRIRFASGRAAEQLAAEIDDLGAQRVMVIAGEFERELAQSIAADAPVALWHHEVAPHVPVAIAERARRAAAEHDVDALVCVGGGSTTGLAKAVALTSGLPIVAVPTTYAGSEATNIWGLTDGDVKTTGVHARVLPRTIIYDAELTLTLPVELSVASGLNAVAHCVDSFWAPRADPINAAGAADGLRLLAAGLRGVVKDPSDLAGRELLLQGAYASAVAFASAGSGLHHKICHVLGGMFNLPHAETHAIVLPHVLALNGAAAPSLERRIADALSSDTATAGLAALRDDIHAPSALRDHGMPEAGIEPATEAILPQVPPKNPADIDRAGLVALLRAAWAGEDPR